jgi:type I restriction enzyme M protein
MLEQQIFEEEEAIDLKAVSQTLKQLEVEMKSTDAVIAGYCKELGIETPF